MFGPTKTQEHIVTVERSERWAVWRVRVMFAATLLVFSEWVVWQQPLAFSAAQWLGWAVLYLALAALSLDLLVRFRANEPLSLLLLAGVYGLLDATLISHITTRDLPVSLIVRPLAAQPLAFLGALAVLRWLLGGGRMRWGGVLIAALSGAAWGVWVRWLPRVSDIPLPATDAPTAALGLGIAAAFLWALSRTMTLSVPRQRHAWLLGELEWWAVGAVLVVALGAGMRQGALSGEGLSVAVGLAAFLLLVLALTPLLRAEHTPLDALTPPRGLLGAGAWTLVASVFLAFGWVGFHQVGAHQSNWLFGALTAFGALWPPTVSMAVGMQAIAVLSRREL